MKNKKPHIRIESYGRYTPWDKESRKLPGILEFTHIIEATEGNEFGMTLLITGGRGIRLSYCIKHPPYKNDCGDIERYFTGEYRINSNHYEFYIGDCISVPVEEKIGVWEFTVYFRNNKIAAQKFEIVPCNTLTEK